MHYTTYYSSPVGYLKLQCSDEHLTELLFADEPGAINNSHPILIKSIAQLNEYFDGKRKSFDLPLQQNGTEFQVKIWDLLSKIPYGKTISYMNLTKQFGDVKAIRAVAAANGKNKLAIIVPCHRVIGSNSKLTGYAGGLWRKQFLLSLEAKHHSGVQVLNF